MILGALRPSRPWRWALLVGIFVPFVEFLAFLFLRTKPYRAQVFESLLALLPAAIGAYGGAFGRGVINNLWRSKTRS